MMSFPAPWLTMSFGVASATMWFVVPAATISYSVMRAMTRFKQVLAKPCCLGVSVMMRFPAMTTQA